MEKKPNSTPAKPSIDVQALQTRDVDGWAHHVVDLTKRSGKVVSTASDRPIGTRARLSGLKKFNPARFGGGNYGPVPERVLSPRIPYVSAPLSYLNALGLSWMFSGEGDVLSWAEFGAPNARYGGIEFWFRDVVPGSIALVTLTADIGATGPGVTGMVEIRSSDASPRQFAATGFQTHVLDIVVRPSMNYACLVTLTPQSGIGYVGFKRAEYAALS